ncbi:MAG: S8 family serine peptidase, partial [Chitinophagaceae bacterium]
TPGYHGTHTTGTAAGGGLIDAKNKGMAPKATIVSQYYSDIILNTSTYVTDHNMNITSNSYYSAFQACPGNGVYDVLSNFIDAQAKNNSQVLHVIAAGNDGTYTCNPFPNAFATIKSGWQTGKNILTVGAYDNFGDIISYFSSRGPLKDGRIKPEIVTGGWAINSTVTNNGYAYNYGTSMSAPTAAGSIALLTQRYKELNGNSNPSSALLKALVCNTAEDKGNAGPDFTFGFGNLNTRRAVEALEGARYFTQSVSTGGGNNHIITIPPGAVQLKVLITWTDKAAAALSSVALVNDLDLSVSEPVIPIPVIHLPMVLNATPGGVNLPAVEGVDHINNIEQAIINNPVAGNYTINVKGFSVPFGPQDYVVAYDVIMPGVTVEYPSGGETIVNGETEYIRWSAYGTGPKSFLVEFSENDGGSWTPIDTLPSTARSSTWNVPVPNATNDALIKVSVLETSFTDQSDHTFTIMERPVLGIGLTCPGSVMLSWAAATGATGYDVLILDNDSMKLIGSTTALFFNVHALDPNKEYWFSVKARNGTGAGRQSISKKIIANGGGCTLSTFDNDLMAVAITAPVNAREFTANALNATQPIKILVRNLDNITSSGNFDLSYAINGGSAVTETIAPVIAAYATFTHTFAQHSTLPGPGTYNIKVWITRTSDLQKGNDTAKVIVKLLANPPISLPFTEDFESAIIQSYTSNVTGMEGLDNFDFITNTSRGRARSFVNSGFAYNGIRSITLDQSPFSATENADSLLMTNNLSNYSLDTNQLRLDFFYRHHNAVNLPGNKVWIRGSESAPWIEAYNLYANQAELGNYKAASAINFNDLLLNAIPPQDITSSMQVKFGQEGYTSANSIMGSFDVDNGYTFDQVKLSLALNDVAITQVVSPTKSGCGLGANTPVSVKVRNYNNVILNNILVSYSINGATPVSEQIGQLNPNQILDFTFVKNADLSAYIDYDIDIWINYGADNYNANDSVLNYKFHNSPLINTYPYLENFESRDGYWYAQGTNSSWQWGSPSKSNITGAPNGSKAWVTSLSGSYRDNEASYLYSPCFNLTGLTQPVLSFSHIFKIEDGCDCDYHWLEYSNDGGLSWQKLGTQGSGTNWYDNSTQQKWQLSRKKWHVASIDIPTTGSNIRFRFVLNSDGGVTDEGAGIDDIHIFDKKLIYTGPSITTLSQNVDGNVWTDFNSGGKRIVSINANGQTLGLTNVQVHLNTNAVRDTFNLYHLDRSIVIRPANPPSLPVTVRYYFTDKEADTLMKATGCATCATIFDPYKSAIMKYSGTLLEENGTFADNATGLYYVIPAIGVEIVPYDNGYYAEFTVCSFSEFWINNGNTTFPQPYVFAGNGNWNIASNWNNNSIPPSPLPAGKEIIINPVTNCILNVPFTVLTGGKITLISGKDFIIQGNLNLQ